MDTIDLYIVDLTLANSHLMTMINLHEYEAIAVSTRPTPYGRWPWHPFLVGILVVAVFVELCYEWLGVWCFGLVLSDFVDAILEEGFCFADDEETACDDDEIVRGYCARGDMDCFG